MKVLVQDLDETTLAIAAGDWGQQDPVTPVPGYFPEDPQAWLDRHNAFVERAQSGNIRVLFLGDSITEAWSHPEQHELWAKHFMSLPADNFGIGGDRTQQILWRIDHGTLDGIDPEAVVLMIGVNNLWSQSHSSEEVSGGIRAVIDRIFDKLPSTSILLQAILPTGELPQSPHRAQIIEINELISKFDDGARVRFINFGDQFLESDGRISAETMPDFCHLSTDSYAKWVQSIDGLLREMLTS